MMCMKWSSLIEIKEKGGPVVRVVTNPSSCSAEQDGQ